MQVLILSEAFPPETKSASTLFFELAESLVKLGNQVTVVTRQPRYYVAEGSRYADLPRRENMSGISVLRYQIPPFARNIPLIRGLEHFIIALATFWAALWIKKVDVILVYSPPLPLGITGYLLSRIKRKKLVVNVQDLYPQTVIDLGLLKNRFLIWVSRWMERFIYREADYLTVHSEGNRNYVLSRGAKEKTTRVIDNWVDTSLIVPGKKRNAFSEKYGITNKFVVSFAGVMGFAQGLDVVVQAAAKLREISDIIFVLVGDGVKKNALIDEVKRLGLTNVLFIPTQPVSIYPQVLAASEVCLVTLGKDLATPVVPGKLLSIMAAGRPVVASLPLSGDTPKIIEKAGCGICLEPDNADKLAEEICKLYNDAGLREKMGKSGRAFAEENFSRTVCVNKYDQLLHLAIERG